MHKKQKGTPPDTRFSHSPPGHTCGLPCCSEDIHIHINLQGPNQRYGCMPVPYGQTENEHNFTLRRKRLIEGKPTFTNKFYSLQTAGGSRRRIRSAIPRFHDDHDVCTTIAEDDEEIEQVSDNSVQDSHRYKAAIESDTDSKQAQPYLDSLEFERNSRIRIPVQKIKSGNTKCFHKREIFFPDTPGTPRQMVFLDYRPGESQDGSEPAVQQDNPNQAIIEVHASDINVPDTSSSVSSSSMSSSTSTHLVKKSCLKKPKLALSPKKDIICSMGENADDHTEDDDKVSDHPADHEKSPCHRVHTSLPDLPSMNKKSLEFCKGTDLSDVSSMDHVYETVHDSEPSEETDKDGKLATNAKAQTNASKLPLPPLPMNLISDHNRSESSLSLYTNNSLSSHEAWDETSERYSTFPRRQPYYKHVYEKLLPRGKQKGNTTYFSSSRKCSAQSKRSKISRLLNIFALKQNSESDGTLNQYDEADDNDLYDELNPTSFLSDLYISGHQSGPSSLSSFSSPNLSVDSLGTYGYTCKSGKPVTLTKGVQNISKKVESGTADQSKELIKQTEGKLIKENCMIYDNDSIDRKPDIGKELECVTYSMGKLGEDQDEEDDDDDDDGDDNDKERNSGKKKVGHIEFSADSPITLIL